MLFDGKFEVVVGDVREVVGSLAGVFDACLCDPPYGLKFMGKAWDHGVPSSEVWAGILSKLRPGAHLIAFGGTRTFHRLGVAIEDAGFEIRDCLSWMYGQGFPKSHSLKGSFEGYGTALKPAWEPAILAMKPLDGTFAQNALEHGVAGLAIDRARVGVEQTVTRHTRKALGTGRGWHPEPTGETTTNVGRWPANVLLDEDAAARLDEQSGVSSDGVAVNHNRGPVAPSTVGFTSGHSGRDEGYGGFGGASRFFYTAKTSPKERHAGLDKGENTHPTLKPVRLTEYLAKLLLPPPREDGQPRRILVPFSGVGSEVAGCLRAGWDEVVGIELDPDYANLSRRRVPALVSLTFKER